MSESGAMLQSGVTYKLLCMLPDSSSMDTRMLITLSLSSGYLAMQARTKSNKVSLNIMTF
eukprot:12413129-Karenia_brevis.AAC.1